MQLLLRGTQMVAVKLVANYPQSLSSNQAGTSLVNNFEPSFLYMALRPAKAILCTLKCEAFQFTVWVILPVDG